MNTNYGKLTDGKFEFAPNALELPNKVILNPTAADYLAQGWKAVSNTAPTDAPTGKHYEASGWEESATAITRLWSLVDDEVVPRTFSKLKCYGALVQLGKWAEAKAWLEAQNLWDAFLLAQDVREDNEYFTAGLAQFKTQFGMTDAEVEAILAQCVADEGV